MAQVSIPNTAMPNRRARRSAAQAVRRGDRPCDVPHCSNTCKRALPDCQHVVCTHCVFNMLGVRPGDGGPVFAFKCPICRKRYDAASASVIHQMATFATGHVKEMPCCCGTGCGKVYAVKHSTCSKGCYDCDESRLDLELLDNELASDDSSEPGSSGSESTDAEAAAARPVYECLSPFVLSSMSDGRAMACDGARLPEPDDATRARARTLRSTRFGPDELPTLNRWEAYFSTEHGCSEGQALCIVVANAAALCAQSLPPAAQVLADGPLQLRVDLEELD